MCGSQQIPHIPDFAWARQSSKSPGIPGETASPKGSRSKPTAIPHTARERHSLCTDAAKNSVPQRFCATP